MWKKGLQMVKDPKLLLKGISFPHYPQPYPQKLSTARKSVDIHFRLHTLFRQGLTNFLLFSLAKC